MKVNWSIRPVLKKAVDAVKQYKDDFIEGDDLHWDDIDEDIHISSFFESAESNMDNPVAAVFKRFPQLNVSEVARTMGINKSLLSRYIYGIKKLSQQRVDQIMNTIREIGQQMASI